MAVFGSEMFIRPELSGLALTLESCLVHEDLADLTDCKSSRDLLQSMQRAGFRLQVWLYRHPQQQLAHTASPINSRAAQSRLKAANEFLNQFSALLH